MLKIKSKQKEKNFAGVAGELIAYGAREKVEKVLLNNFIPTVNRRLGFFYKKAAPLRCRQLIQYQIMVISLAMFRYPDAVQIWITPSPQGRVVM